MSTLYHKQISTENTVMSKIPEMVRGKGGFHIDWRLVAI